MDSKHFERPMFICAIAILIIAADVTEGGTEDSVVAAKGDPAFPEWYARVERSRDTLFAVASCEIEGDEDAARNGATKAAANEIEMKLMMKIHSVLGAFEGNARLDEVARMQVSIEAVTYSRGKIEADRVRSFDLNSDGRDDVVLVRSKLSAKTVVDSLRGSLLSRWNVQNPEVQAAIASLESLVGDEFENPIVQIIGVDSERRAPRTISGNPIDEAVEVEGEVEAEWYERVERSPEALHAVGSAGYAGDIQVAKDAAENASRRNLSVKLGSVVENVLRAFAERSEAELDVIGATQAVVSGARNGIFIDKSGIADTDGDGIEDRVFARATLGANTILEQLRIHTRGRGWGRFNDDRRIELLSELLADELLGGEPETEEAEEPEEQEAAEVGIDIPDWYMNIEHSSDALYSTGAAIYAGDLEMAKRGAETAARRAMGAILETKIGYVLASYAAMIENGEDIVTEQIAREISRAVVYSSQTSIMIDKQYLGDQNGDGRPDTFFARAVLTADVVAQSLHEEASKRIALVRDDAAEAFNELDRLLAEEFERE
ncbi:MAG: hypothetical protein NUW37_07695 [Planctomycetes bacterium]|nr:hypothetical protein [Planctomycetota bacterium]